MLIDTYLDKSKIHGVGVFSNQNVKKGERNSLVIWNLGWPFK
jgi:SET domain-containing protein